MKNKRASATLVVLVLGIVFLIYAFSAYSDILNLDRVSDQYVEGITGLYDDIYLIQEGLL